MGLKEVMEETREQLEAANKREGEAQEAEFAKLDAITQENPAEIVEEKPVVEETNPVEEAAHEEEKPVEEKKTPTEYSKERQARKDKLSAEVASANARIAELEKRLAPQVETGRREQASEPDINTNPTEWVAWKLKQQDTEIKEVAAWKAEQQKVKSREDLRQRAVNELTGYEDQMRKTATDYDDVKNYYGSMMAASIKIMNPNIAQDKLLELVNNRIITRAAELQSEGYENPVEAMYLEAKGLGYKPREATSDEQPKPDLDKISAAKKRNAGMTGGSGGGGDSVVTAKVAAGYTSAEWMKLKPEQKKKIFQSLR